MDAWVSVRKIRPHENTPVLICWDDDDSLSAVGYVRDGRWFEKNLTSEDRYITPPDYWMNLATPPAHADKEVVVIDRPTLLDYYACSILGGMQRYPIADLPEMVSKIFDVAEIAVAESRKRQPKQDSGE